MSKKTRKTKRNQGSKAVKHGNVVHKVFDDKKWHPLSEDIDNNRDKKFIKTVKPRSDGQKELIDAIKVNSLTFAVGPAGTGKTYLAIARPSKH